MLEALSKKQKIFFYIILFIMIIVIIYYIYSRLYKENHYINTNLNENDLIETTTELDMSNSEILENNTIVVYVCGAVKENKVVSLKENSRICDAIDAVGGVLENANLTNINLAYILEDGEKIYIPKIGENLENESLSSFDLQNSSYTNYSSNTLKNNKININKATQTELETIPGIGPSTALKIINYRKENGKFLKIEDIKNVPGIGESKYEKLKNYITVK